MNIKRYFLLLLLFLSPLFSNNLKEVSLQLQWKYQFQFAGFIMAKEKGFYKDQGLNVNIKEWKKGINMVDEVVKGTTNYAIARPSALIDVANGANISILAAIYQSSPLIILADKKSGIKSLKDFNKKRLMTTGDLDNDAALMTMLFSNKVDIKTMIMQTPSFNVKDLLNGKTDLMSAYISNEPYVLKELGGNPVIFNPKDYGFDFYNDFIITSTDYLKKNTAEVKNFKEASLEGWKYAFSHIEETVNIILKKYNTQHKSKKALLYEAKELKKLAFYHTDKIGEVNVDKLAKIYDVYKILGLVKKNIDLKKLIFNPSTIVLSKEEKDYLLKKKNITMCVDPNWMPFEKIEDGKHIGLSAQYIKLFSEKLNISFKLIPTKTWQESMKLAKNRTCDILSLAMETPSRKKYFNFTEPYLSVPLVIVTKLDIPFLNDISNLKNKKVAIIKDYAFVELLKAKYPYLNIVEVKDIDEGLNKVDNGDVFAYIGAVATVEYAFQNKYFNKLKITGKINDGWELGVAVRNDDKTLLDILNKTIKDINIDQRQDILDKWISLSYKKQIDYSLILKILVVVSILIIFFLYKQYFLKKSIKDFDELINATVEGLVISKNGICIDANQSAITILGLKRKEDIIGKTLLDFVSDESKQMVNSTIKIPNVEPYEAVMKRKDGSKFFALIRGHDLKNNKMRISSVIDISLIKNQEKMLIEQSKMAALGEMISNIAHQWRQPLAAISASSTGMILQKEHNILSEESFLNSCNSINNYAQYLSKTIDDFKNYAKGDTQPKIFILKEETEKFLLLVDSFIKTYDITIDLDVKEAIIINGFPNELIQCFINLFYNSKDVFLAKKELDKRIIQIIQQKEHGFASIIFRDNGGGIDPDIIKRIFEPYFTTKHKSQGTGLGLHMTYNLIMNSMKGSIIAKNIDFSYQDKKYLGAEFIIKIPLEI